MSLTRSLPTRPGWYYLQLGGQYIVCARVEIYDKRLFAYWPSMYGTSNARAVDTDGLVWLGSVPIPPSI